MIAQLIEVHQLEVLLAVKGNSLGAVAGHFSRPIVPNLLVLLAALNHPSLVFRSQVLVA